MIQISNLTLTPGQPESCLRQQAAQLLGVPEDSLGELTIVRQSIDARRKSAIKLSYSVRFSHPEEETLPLPPGVSRTNPKPYCFPPVQAKLDHPPVIVGMGPAGLFCALFLARAGVPCLILERGKPVEERVKQVEGFWDGGDLDPESNVQFGEGGAGTFSDGKLTTGIRDPRVKAVLEVLVEAGAPEDIQWQSKPHIGTDLLRQVVIHLRQELLNLGCEIRLGHKLTGLVTRGDRLTGFTARGPEGSYEQACDRLVLAPGHSARDTFQMLFEQGITLCQKAFAIGVRIEHRQEEISQAQYGPMWEKLPPADYKLACHLPSGRSAFTFCVCPGGQVVAAVSEPGCLVTNGMSCRARDGKNINGGLLVGVGPGDFGSEHPLAGIAFQRQWETKAFQLGGGDYHAPAQCVAEVLGRRIPKKRVEATYRPGVRPAQLDQCLPHYVMETIVQSLPLMGRKLRGFSADGALLTGVETRSSSPVRIVRGEDYQSVSLPGLYPCGEGAGYAGGITSAAADGIRTAEAIASDR